MRKLRVASIAGAVAVASVGFVPSLAFAESVSVAGKVVADQGQPGSIKVSGRTVIVGSEVARALAASPCTSLLAVASGPALRSGSIAAYSFVVSCSEGAFESVGAFASGINRDSVPLEVTNQAVAGVVGTAIDGIVGTGIEGIVGTGIEGIVGTGIEGIVGTGIEGIVGTGIEGIVGTGIEGIVGTGIEGIVGTGIEGIVGTGIEGIVGTGIE